SDVWKQTCLQTLLKNRPGNETSGCLWSLTFVIKGVLKGEFEHEKEILDNLFIVLDPILNDLYSSMFSPRDVSQEPPGYSEDTSDSETNLTSFISLLEVLITARTRLCISASSPRLLFIQASLALQLVICPVHHIVRKKMLLLLKRCLLQKAGEDFSLGEVDSSLKRDIYFYTDMLALANAVLHSVDSGWLGNVSVNSSTSFFGGDTVLYEGTLEMSDFVMLRAASLVLLKSLEYKVQQSRKEGGVAVVEIQSYLHPLMLFLKKNLKSPEHSQQLCHPCSWLSVVFMDQDDDMIEAAKTLLILYSHFRSTTDAEFCNTPSLDQMTHENGFNPHCHFLILLNSVAFDHTLLLDFLISAETCFLEYFVGYLKLLRESWQEFCSVCLYFEGQNSRRGLNDAACGEQSANVLLSERTECDQKPAALANPAVGSSTTAQSIVAESSHSEFSVTEVISCSAGPLVDYGSSEESESEELYVSDGFTHRIPSPEGFQRKSIRGGEQDSTQISCVTKEAEVCVCSTQPKGLWGDQPILARMCHQSIMCLTGLRKVICRLQRRNLFPYKPACLLKLLMQIETISGLSE
ncbi:LINES protein, partial [Amia calva]|nr:LINES protein [Amia calva]